MPHKDNNGFSSPEQEMGKSDEKKRALFFLLLLTLITSCLAGYMLGRRAAPAPSGMRIDTILLTPPDSAKDKAVERVFHLTGKIVYTNGEPYANGRIQLHSDPRETITDQSGSFSFFHVEKGRHQIKALDGNGGVLGERQVEVTEADPNSGVNVDLRSDGKYTIEVAVDVRMLEVEIELDRENNEMYINGENITYCTSQGRVVTPAGETSYFDRAVVTPGGSVILTDGTIIRPVSDGPLGIAVLTPEDEVIYPEQQLALPDGTQVTDGGSLVLPSGTAVEVNETGTVILPPEGSASYPGSGGVVISDGNEVIPIGHKGSGPAETSADTSDAPLPESRRDPDYSTDPVSESVSEPVTKPDPYEESVQLPDGSQDKAESADDGKNNGSSSAGNSGGHSGGGHSGGGSGSTGGHGGTGGSESSGADESTGESDTSGADESTGESESSGADESTGGSESSGADESTGGSESSGADESTSESESASEPDQPLTGFDVSWTQDADIDLFSNVTGGGANQTIMPGSKGYYPFILKNDNAFPINFTLSVYEETTHLSMRFRIVEEGKEALTGWWDTREKEFMESEMVVLPANDSKSYRLVWEWPYESGNDASDTAAGTASNRNYIVRLKIRAEQAGS